ncbi:hypothetical protein AVEN_187292-1 [Araneus ventricosus]|uniref:Uncharacterized protein n=1 Tax=Araneus ventricosus TaxID=182803 RepID=A0A4Y2NSR5_ARAVE|nr:hypothetical protein AVEN_187292-1 [Araneus ventricosus]
MERKKETKGLILIIIIARKNIPLGKQEDAVKIGSFEFILWSYEFPIHIMLKYHPLLLIVLLKKVLPCLRPVTYLELNSRRKALVNISCRHPPAHSWYRSEGPGAAIRFKGDRKDKTARLSSGHLKTSDSLVVIRSSISA